MSSTKPTFIRTWRDRLDWTKERSPSSSERMRAMQEEIRDLRMALEKSLRQIELAAKPNRRLEMLLNSARERVIFWRKLASKK